MKVILRRIVCIKTNFPNKEFDWLSFSNLHPWIPGSLVILAGVKLSWGVLLILLPIHKHGGLLQEVSRSFTPKWVGVRGPQSEFSPQPEYKIFTKMTPKSG